MSQENLRNALQKTLAQTREDQLSSGKYLEEACKSNTAGFLNDLSEILANVQENAFVRQAAGLQLKNVLTAKDVELKSSCLSRWFNIPVDVREKIKTNVLGTLGTETTRPSIAAQCVAAIAYAEMSYRQWPDCVPYLTGSITKEGSSESLQAACLETLGYMCQDMNPKSLGSYCNAILTAIVHGMRSDGGSNYVRLVATEALHNSLEFTKSNFENEQERNVIMQVVCEATQSSDLQVKVMALQCLVRIMSLYYDRMEVYMKAALFAITLEAMKSENDEVVLQGIEFWSNVCDEELLLAVEQAEAMEKNTTQVHVSRNYAGVALEYILPILLEIMTRGEETDDDEEWIPSKASGVCLMLLSQCVGDQMVPMALPFVANNMNHVDWRRRDAALMAFGSILDGPDKKNLAILVREGLAMVINGLTDNHTMVRDTAAWSLGRICEFCGEIVCQPEYIQPLIPVIFNGLTQEPRVASNVCWAISSLASAAHDVATMSQEIIYNPETCAISTFYESLLAELLKVAERPDGGQSNLRIAAFEAIMELIKTAPKDCYQIVQNLTMTTLQRMQQLIDPSLPTTDEALVTDLQSLFCAVLQTLLRRLDKAEVMNSGDAIMTLLLHYIISALNRSSAVVEEAMLSCATFVEIAEKDFIKYFDALKPYVNFALSCTNDAQLCTCAVGLLDDLTRALERQMAPHMEEYMSLLINILRTPDADKNLKCLTITVLGDMAIAADLAFIPYLPTTLETIVQALNIQVDDSDYDELEFVNTLRQNCFEAFTSVVQAMRTSDAMGKVKIQDDQTKTFIEQYGIQVAHIIDKVLPCIYNTEEVLLAAVGVVGIASVLPGTLVEMMLSKGAQMRSERGQSVYEWTMKKLSTYIKLPGY